MTMLEVVKKLDETREKYVKLREHHAREIEEGRAAVRKATEARDRALAAHVAAGAQVKKAAQKFGISEQYAHKILNQFRR